MHFAKIALRATGLFIVLSMPLAPAQAAEIKVMYPPPLRTALNDLFPQFERTSGHKLALIHESSWLLVERASARARCRMWRS